MHKINNYELYLLHMSIIAERYDSIEAYKGLYVRNKIAKKKFKSIQS